MDNILFVPAIRELEWVQDILPGTSPAELSVGGRRVIEYALESAHKFEVMFTEVLDWRFSEQLADYFADPTRTLRRLCGRCPRRGRGGASPA